MRTIWPNFKYMMIRRLLLSLVGRRYGAPVTRSLASESVPATKIYERPERMKDNATHEAGQSIIISSVLCLALWAAIWFGVVEPQKKKFMAFYRDLNPDKVFFQQRQAGVFQSVRPLAQDDPEYWMGTYCASKGSESQEDFLKLLKRFPELDVKVISK